MKALTIIPLLILLIANVAEAHFIWLKTSLDGKKSKVNVYFGESAESDDPEYLGRVATAKAWTTSYHGEPKELKLIKTEQELSAKLSGRVVGYPVILKHTYGVFSRGDASFLLNYYAKSYPHPLPGSWKEVDDAKRLPFEITPSSAGTDTILHVTWKGDAAPGCEVVIIGPGIDKELKGSTDEAGNFRCKLPAKGVYSIRARKIDETAGKYKDDKYEASRHYTTLTLPYSPLSLASVQHKLTELPQGTTSFGGAISGDNLYIYGGNYGTAHEYSQDGQSNDLWMLNLAKPSKWAKVATGPKLQGLAMIAHRGSLYRVGGFTAMNKEGDDQDLQSQTKFARYDLKQGKWTELPSLPEPRSSLDAAVVKDVLYVAGGWNMPGKGKDAIWHTTAYALELNSESPNWKKIAKQPFTRRALSLGAWNGKLVCIGGMQKQGGPTTRCDIYDPSTDKWVRGPSLLGGSLDGFGSSAFEVNGSLYASTITGSIQRLADDGKSWELVGQLDHPRFFHRLLPWKDSSLIAVGGGNMSVGKILELDQVKLK